MKIKRYIILGTFASLTALIFTSALTSPSGIGGKNGSPGETTCQGCHGSFALNSGGGSVVISCPNMINWEYAGSTAYNINVTVSKTGVNLYGFGFEALQNSGANAGSLAVTNVTQTQIKAVTVLGNSRNTMTHLTNSGIGTGTKTFSFQWTSPATNIGNVTFYAVGNAANGNNNSSGDYIYSTNHVVNPLFTGINTIATAADWNVYPNPVKNNLNVSFNTIKNDDVKIELYDINGKFQEVLMLQTMEKGSHLLNYEINTTYAEGIYFVRMQQGNSISMKKIFIKQ